jgi:hypothetical protein
MNATHVMHATAHTRPRRRRKLIARFVGIVNAIREAHRQWYGDEMRRQRRVVEEDARRLGGTVTWSDTP